MQAWTRRVSKWLQTQKCEQAQRWNEKGNWQKQVKEPYSSSKSTGRQYRKEGKDMTKKNWSKKE